LDGRLGDFGGGGEFGGWLDGLWGFGRGFGTPAERGGGGVEQREHLGGRFEKGDAEAGAVEGGHEGAGVEAGDGEVA